MATITLLRMPDLIQRLGVSRSLVYKIMETDGFPRPIKLSRRVVAWCEEEVDDYLTHKKQLRTSETD